MVFLWVFCPFCLCILLYGDSLYALMAFLCDFSGDFKWKFKYDDQDSRFWAYYSPFMRASLSIEENTLSKWLDYNPKTIPSIFGLFGTLVGVSLLLFTECSLLVPFYCNLIFDFDVLEIHVISILS